MVKKKSDKRALFLLLAIAVGVLIITSVISSSLSNVSTSSVSNVKVINVYGEINSQRVSTGIFSIGRSSSDLVKEINSANEDRGIDAVMFRIDSPGGTPVASHEIVRAIKSLDKPSISVIRELGASGAYWVASGTDFIVSDELSLTGSVGVLGGFFDIHGLLERYNISYERFTGGELKDLGSPFREITEEERIILQSKIDLMHDFFLDDVKSNRNLSEENFSQVSTGAYFIGLEAIDLGLVDMLGSEEHAILWLEETLNSSVRLIERQERGGLFSGMAGFNLNSLNSGFRVVLR